MPYPAAVIWAADKIGGLNESGHLLGSAFLGLKVGPGTGRRHPAQARIIGLQVLTLRCFGWCEMPLQVGGQRMGWALPLSFHSGYVTWSAVIWTIEIPAANSKLFYARGG